MPWQFMLSYTRPRVSIVTQIMESVRLELFCYFSKDFLDRGSTKSISQFV